MSSKKQEYEAQFNFENEERIFNDKNFLEQREEAVRPGSAKNSVIYSMKWHDVYVVILIIRGYLGLISLAGEFFSLVQNNHDITIIQWMALLFGLVGVILSFVASKGLKNFTMIGYEYNIALLVVTTIQMIFVSILSAFFWLCLAVIPIFVYYRKRKAFFVERAKIEVWEYRCEKCGKYATQLHKKECKDLPEPIRLCYKCYQKTIEDEQVYTGPTCQPTNHPLAENKETHIQNQESQVKPVKTVSQRLPVSSTTSKKLVVKSASTPSEGGASAYVLKNGKELFESITFGRTSSAKVFEEKPFLLFLHNAYALLLREFIPAHDKIDRELVDGSCNRQILLQRLATQIDRVTKVMDSLIAARLVSDSKNAVLLLNIQSNALRGYNYLKAILTNRYDIEKMGRTTNSTSYSLELINNLKAEFPTLEASYKTVIASCRTLGIM